MAESIVKRILNRFLGIRVPTENIQAEVKKREILQLHTSAEDKVTKKKILKPKRSFVLKKIAKKSGGNSLKKKKYTPKNPPSIKSKKPQKIKRFVLNKIKKTPKKQTASRTTKTSHKVNHAKKSLAVATGKNAENRKIKKLQGIARPLGESKQKNPLRPQSSLPAKPILTARKEITSLRKSRSLFHQSRKPKREPNKPRAIKISKGKNATKGKVRPKRVTTSQDKHRMVKVSTTGKLSTSKKTTKVRKSPKIIKKSGAKAVLKPVRKHSKELSQGIKTRKQPARGSAKATKSQKPVKLHSPNQSRSSTGKKSNQTTKTSQRKREARLRNQQRKAPVKKRANSGSTNRKNVNKKLDQLKQLASEQGYLTTDDLSEILSEHENDPAFISDIKNGLRIFEIEVINPSSVDRCREITVQKSDNHEFKTNPDLLSAEAGGPSKEATKNKFSKTLKICFLRFPYELKIDSAKLKAASDNPRTRAVDLNSLNMSVRALNVLSFIGYASLGQLIDSVRDGLKLAHVRNLGKKTYEEIANLILLLHEAFDDSGNINWSILQKQNLSDLDAISQPNEKHTITRQNQKYPRLRYHSEMLSNLDELTRHLHIGNLHLDIKAALFFEKRGIETLGGFIDQIKDGIDFSKERNLGKVAFHDIINCTSSLENSLISGNLDWSTYARLRNFPVFPDRWDSSQKLDLAEIAELVRLAVTSQYAGHAVAGGNRFLDILENRILRENSQKLTLEEISEKHALTRERIRQNELDIYRVLRGALLERLYSVRCKLDSRVRFDCLRFRFQPALEDIFANAKKALAGFEIMGFVNWSAVVSASTGFSEDEIQKYNHFLASILGYEVRYMSFSRKLSGALVCNETHPVNITKEIIETIEDIHFFFEDKPNSISIDELNSAFHLNESLEKTEFSLQKILDLCPTILRSQEGSLSWKIKNEFYKPKVGKLILDEAEKILRNNNERMHFQDLFRKIKNMLPEMDIPERYLSMKLHYDPRFNCIGKKGYWFLTEWNYQTGSILECLLIILNDSKDSLSLNELVVDVQRMNPSKPGSIKGTLQNRSDVFIKLPGNRYDLRERYPNRSKTDDEF
jgi:hypothetical protein